MIPSTHGVVSFIGGDILTETCAPQMILFPEEQYSINVQSATTLGASVLIGRFLRTINLSSREVEAPTEFHQSARLVAATLRSAVSI